MVKVDVHRVICITGVLLLELVGAGQLSAQQVNYYGGMQYSTGSYYFYKPTKSFYVGNGISINSPRYNISLNYPFVVQNSPWVSQTGTGAMPTGGPQHEAVGLHNGTGSGHGMGRRTNISIPDTAKYSNSGFSDPVVTSGYRFYVSDEGNTIIQANVSVKFPVANPSAGFGTGEWDAGAGGSVNRRMGTWFLMGNAMYWRFGDMPNLVLKDALSYGAGIGKSIDQGRWMILGVINGMTEVIDGIDPPLTTGISIGHQVTPATNLNAGVSIGTNESTSDVSFGVGWTIKLN